MLKTISIVQIFGGILGMSALANSEKSEGTLLVLSLSFFLFCFSILCGGLLLLYRRKDIVVLTKVNQVLQIIGFSIIGVGSFNYDSGIYFSIGLDLVNEILFLFNFGISSNFTFEISSTTSGNFLTLNLIPLLIYLFLNKREPNEDAN